MAERDIGTGIGGTGTTGGGSTGTGTSGTGSSGLGGTGADTNALTSAGLAATSGGSSLGGAGTGSSGTGSSGTGSSGTGGADMGGTDGSGLTGGSGLGSSGLGGSGSGLRAGSEQEEFRSTTDMLRHGKDQMLDEARTMVRSMADQQKTRAGDSLREVAGALRDMGRNMTGEQQWLGRYTDMAGDQVERVATMLQERDWDDLMDEASRFARRQPTLFIGGAFLVGMLASRFLKSGGDRYEAYSETGVETYDRADWSTPAGTSGMGASSYPGASTGTPGYGSGTGMSATGGATGSTLGGTGTASGTSGAATGTGGIGTTSGTSGQFGESGRDTLRGDLS